MKNKVILGIIIINIILTYIIILNNYKHYNANIEDNNINYNYSNLAIYQKKDTEACKTSTDDSCYDEVPTLPNGEDYIINQEKSVCYLRSSDKHYDRLYTNQNGEHVIQNMLKEEKCYVYFDKAPEKDINILAKLNDETINFPTKGSKNPKSVTCTNDVTAKFNYNKWQVEVDAIEEGATTCIVEFEEFTPQPFNEYLTNNASNLGLVEEKGLRYEGIDIEVNNYVLFNNELWRIIGVFEIETETSGTQKLVKLIRAEALDGIGWYNSKWEGSSIHLLLNNEYLNRTDAQCYYTYDSKKACLFSRVGISAEAEEKIEAVKWNVGRSDHKQNADTIFKDEIGTQTTKFYKVGLMGASDYGYAVKADSCDRSTTLNMYNTSVCAGSNWLKNVGFDWTITNYLSDAWDSLDISNSGNLINNGTVYGLSARPSVYLKSNIQVLGGTGYYDNPYIIN